MAKKPDITDLLKKAKEKEKYIAPVQETHTIQPEKQSKMGRPSEKDFDNVKYVKLCARVPEETRDKIKIYLVKHKEYRTQDEFINAAILHFLSNQG